MVLYQGYQAFTDAMTPLRMAAQLSLSWRDRWGTLGQGPMARRGFALAEMLLSARFTHDRPSYDITQVQSGNAMVGVREEVVTQLPFGNLLHFAKDDVGAPQPRMLVIAPLSGHFATLLRDTVHVLLRDHDVYITDWKNARDVPLSAGRFGFEDYVDYVIHFIQDLGPRANILAVCQPCVPALAAVALMAEDNDPSQPRTMTLMGGPVDTRVSPTVVNELATSKSLDWFEKKLISRVPWRHKGGGRRVYPGFLQLVAFMSMNLERHGAQYRKLYQHLADGEPMEATRIRDFYDEYFAVLDMPAEYYLETVDLVFQRAALAAGELTHRGRPVRPEAIHRTALLTVEGERDDICAVGQTSAAHLLCSSLRPHLKRHHLQPGVGHYGIFAGSKWEKQVYPQVRNMVLAMA
ncbi:polyhydroxyalkanoate depolymerase [Sphingobium aquiterrae]|uniref:polyhydroxyalkanoate depolymerase n=1 Tax=Sphingobium aquiterrae TaxID=2038656 RepID=UPI00301B6449